MPLVRYYFRDYRFGVDSLTRSRVPASEYTQAVDYKSVIHNNFALVATVTNPVDIYILWSHNTNMRYIFLSLAFIPALAVPGELQMCYRDKAAEYKEQQEKCLATMVYGESRGEAYTGKVAVAYTAVNRAANTSICDVILRPKQYSIFNDNPALRLAAMSPTILPAQKNEVDEAGWQESLQVARLVLNGKVIDPTNGSTHYLAPKVMKLKKYKYPKWSKQYTLVTVIDNHRFYKPVDKRAVRT